MMSAVSAVMRVFIGMALMLLFFLLVLLDRLCVISRSLAFLKAYSLYADEHPHPYRHRETGGGCKEHYPLPLPGCRYCEAYAYTWKRCWASTHIHKDTVRNVVNVPGLLA